MYRRINQEITLNKGDYTYHAHYHTESNQMTVTSGFWRKQVAVNGANEEALAKDVLLEMIAEGHGQVFPHH